MDFEKAPPQRQEPEGRLAVAIRIPVRIVVLVLVVPVRMAWDALVVAGRFLNDTVVRPVGRALLWLGRAVFVWPFVGLWRYVVVPVAKGLAWLGNLLVVVPAVWVYRWVLAPVGRVLAVIGREIRDALGHAWRVAGRISLAVGRFLANLFRWIFVEPVRWVYRTVLTPVGHVVRDVIWRPVAEAARSVGRTTRQILASARQSARQTRADFRRMLFGEPKEPQPVARRKPVLEKTRTLEQRTGRDVSPPTRG